MARVTPWSLHHDARAVESGAGTHTRGGTRGPRPAVHPTFRVRRAALQWAPWMRRTQLPKNQNEPGGRFGGFWTPVGQGKSIQGGGELNLRRTPPREARSAKAVPLGTQN